MFIVQLGTVTGHQELQDVPLKTQTPTVSFHGTKVKSEAGPSLRSKQTLPTSPVTLESRSPFLLGRCSRQLRKSCACANTVYSRAERVFTHKHCFASKSFTAVCEGFSDAYPDKTTIHRLVTTLRDTGSVYCDKCSSSSKTTEITVVSISSSASVATTGYGCKNSILSLV
jgi:hypothetical protein